MTQTTTAPAPSAFSRFIRKKVATVSLFRGIVSLVAFTVLWEVGTIINLPIIGNVPAPSEVIVTLLEQFRQAYYWLSWGDSMMRIFVGFVIAQIIGVPLGLFFFSLAPTGKRGKSSSRFLRSCGLCRLWPGFRFRSFSGLLPK